MWKFGEAKADRSCFLFSLILQGEKDSHVLLEEARAMRVALSDMGLPFAYVIYYREWRTLGEKDLWVDMGKGC